MSDESIMIGTKRTEEDTERTRRSRDREIQRDMIIMMMIRRKEERERDTWSQVKRDKRATCKFQCRQEKDKIT
jgi:hypothetical protein